MSTKINREHSFDVELATIHGIEKSILLKNFAYWVTENERKRDEKYILGGKYWTAESASSLAQKYPYMAKSSLKRWVNELQQLGWLDIAKFQSDVSFYRPGKVFDLWNTGQDWQLAQNEPIPHWPKMSQPLAQNEPTIGPKWADNWPKMGHTNIDYNIESNIELNIEKAEIPIFDKIGENEDQTFKAKKPVKSRTAPRAAGFSESDVAQHLESKEQQFFAQVLANGAWSDYLAHRKELDRFTYKSAQSASQGVRSLIEATNGNADTAMAVVNQSRGKGWKGLFPLKQPTKIQQNVQHTIANSPSFAGAFT